MNSVLSFVVYVLAVKRLTRLVVEDEIARPLRDAAIQENDTLGFLVQCPSCVSIWAALAVLLIPKPLRLPLAGSEAAIFVSNFEAGD